LFLSFVVAVAGGMMRDVVTGAVRPVAITEIPYFLIAICGEVVTFYWYRRVASLQHQISLSMPLVLGCSRSSARRRRSSMASIR
jgi:uncharacterized membrane protein YeiH